MKRIYTVRLSAAALVMAMACSLINPVITMAAPGHYTNRDRNVTNSEVSQALRNTAGVMDTSASVKAANDGDSALKVATAGATVDVPKDADAGVTLRGKDGTSIAVSLPNAAAAGTAQQVGNGVVSYPSNNGSANAVQANADGSVRMLTVIDSPSAPTRYDYKVSVPHGGVIMLTVAGGAVVLGADNKPVASIDVPWAKDANGLKIKTWFATDGQILTQYVKHNVAGVTYPVTADPRISYAWHGIYYYFSRTETNYISLGLSTWLGSKIGGPAAATIFAVGGQWAADQAKKRGQCVAAYKPWAAPMYIHVYITKC